MKRLKAFCTWSKLSPQEIVSRANSSIDDFQHRVEDYVSYLEGSGKSPAYVGNLLKPIRSWLDYKHAPKLAKIKITGSGTNPTTADERVPSQEELARILRFLDPRGRTSAALIAFTGNRIEVLGNYDGTDGLVLGDLPELSIKDKEVVFETIPTMIVVRPSLSKAGHRYFTFLSSEGCRYVKEYLEGRLSGGEALDAKSTLISAYRSYRNRFLYATKVGGHIRTGIRAAGFGWRPYVLKAYADTAFDIAESKGLITHAWRQFFMGHKGDIEARYSTNKGRLPPNMVQEMRDVYKRCEPFMSTEKIEGASEEKIRRAFKEQLITARNKRLSR
ncbi:MAG: site-specific integrase [Thaumarchaeota archaeon]|nr:site-specific integrase [Nitrososphaerota archaeon]